MSRSRKKTPITSRTCGGDRAGEEKAFKVLSHRRYRRAIKLSVRRGDDPVVEPKEVVDVWKSPKDGKVLSDDVDDLRK